MGISRRQFMLAGATSATGLAVQSASAAEVIPGSAMSCILLWLTGGPSQIDTWDPKPDAPANVRGPFGSIATNVPGIRLSEHFPRMAELANRYAIVRSVYHQVAPTHEAGQQLIQTGRLCRYPATHPHIGAMVSWRFGPRRPEVPPFVVLPRLLGDTDMDVDHGQGAGFLGAAHRPVILDSAQSAATQAVRTALSVAGEPVGTRERFGNSAIAMSCLRARRLVEAGVRVVTVNMFDTLVESVTWDCHADRRFLPATLDDYRRTVCPTFDRAFAALVEDLDERGMLESTLVVAAGEFGRTPLLNANGGRDHWPRVWSVLVAGGGVRAGQVIGASDKHGGEPVCRPVRAQDIAATIYGCFGIDPATQLVDSKGNKILLTEGRRIGELFA